MNNKPIQIQLDKNLKIFQSSIPPVQLLPQDPFFFPGDIYIKPEILINANHL